MTPVKGIVCSACGALTEVMETRKTVHGLRRRRECIKRCGGRITTIEFVMPEAFRGHGAPMVLVPLREMERFREALATILGGDA